MEYGNERRQGHANKQTLSSKLNLSQQTAVSSLSNYGYELSFIRETQQGPVVVMLLGGNAVTILGDGEINTAPDIDIR